jgi:hypothetical protein
MRDDPDNIQAKARSLLDMAKDDPVQATIDCSFALQQLEKKREEDLNHLVAVPYGVACHLQDDWTAWVQYIKSPLLWTHRSSKKPRRDKDSGRVLYLVMEATFAGELGKGYQKGWWYARALEDAFIKGIKPTDLPDYIKARKNLKTMYRWAVDNNPKRKRKCDDDDRYFDLSDPEPKTTDGSQGETQEKTEDPTPLPDPSIDDIDSLSDDTHSRRIRPSAALTRKLDNIARRGRAKKLTVVARPSGDEIILRLPKKPTASSWLHVNIQPDHPDTYYGPYHYDTSVPQIASTNWTTYKPWKT